MANSGLVTAVVILLVIALLYYIKVVRSGSSPHSATTTVKEGGLINLICPAPEGDLSQPPSSKNVELRSARFGPPPVPPPTAGAPTVAHNTCKTYDVTATVQKLLSKGVPFDADAKILLTAAQYAEWSAASCSASSTNQLTIDYACPVITGSTHTSSTTYGYGTSPFIPMPITTMVGCEAFATSHPAIEVAESNGEFAQARGGAGYNYRHVARPALSPDQSAASGSGGKFEEVDVAGRMFLRKRPPYSMGRSIYSSPLPTDADLTGFGDALGLEAPGSTRSGGQISGSHWALPRPTPITNRRRTVT